MKFTLMGVLDSLAGVLKKGYPEYPVYIEPGIQETEVPCFFLFLMPSEISGETGGRYLRDLGIDIVFVQQRNIQDGNRSFPKLKIPHQSHADFCSTDTAGGLDNKKRRYAPRGGVAYRLFLWGFPKGATPPFGTRLCKAKCSVLYALPALP